MSTIGESDPVMALKTEHGIPIRNLWYMLMYAWNEPPFSPYWKMVDWEDAPTLDGLLASVLARALQQRLRIGLGRDYIADQKVLRGIRGRIDITNSLKQRTFERGQTFSKFEEYSVNVPKNQTIRSTLRYLSQVGDFGPHREWARNLRHRLFWLTRSLDGVTIVDLTPDFVRRQLQLRHDHDYHIMLAICDFILAKRMPTEQEGYSFHSQLHRERFVLHRLYQQFVTGFYRYHLQDWNVLAEQTLRWLDDSDNSYLPLMRPDLTMTSKLSGGRMIVLDTKFTAKSLIQNQWGKEMFDPSHLYQVYAYLRTQEHRSDLHRKASGVLLYPAVKEDLKEVIPLPNHHIRIECVDLAAPWQAVERRLMDVVMSSE